MTALEEIQQAIETLECLKKESTGGAWEALGGLIETDVEPYEVTPKEVDCMTYCYGGSTKRMRREDAELIVTLHRTIDAQLAILRHVAKFYSGDLGLGINRHVVDLARAINGSAS